MLKLGRRARGHFVTLIEIHVHLIRVKPGHISNNPAFFTVLAVTQTVVCITEDIDVTFASSNFEDCYSNNLVKGCLKHA